MNEFIKSSLNSVTAFGSRHLIQGIRQMNAKAEREINVRKGDHESEIFECESRSDTKTVHEGRSSSTGSSWGHEGRHRQAISEAISSVRAEGKSSLRESREWSTRDHDHHHHQATQSGVTTQSSKQRKTPSKTRSRRRADRKWRCPTTV